MSVSQALHVIHVYTVISPFIENKLKCAVTPYLIFNFEYLDTHRKASGEVYCEYKIL